MSYSSGLPPYTDAWNVEEFYQMPKSEYDGIEPFQPQKQGVQVKNLQEQRNEAAARFRQRQAENIERLETEKQSLEANIPALQEQIAILREENEWLEAYRNQQRIFLATVFPPGEGEVTQQQPTQI